MSIEGTMSINMAGFTWKIAIQIIGMYILAVIGAFIAVYLLVEMEGIIRKVKKWTKTKQKQK